MLATDKQVAFFGKLITARELPTGWVATDMIERAPSASKAGMSAAISRLLDMPRVAVDGGARRETVPQGCYRKDGQVWRVRFNKDKTRLYAELLVEGTKLEWEYVRGAIGRLSNDDRMTVDEVGAIGIAFGVCVICGRTLTVEESIKRGIGPVCIGKV